MNKNKELYLSVTVWTAVFLLFGVAVWGTETQLLWFVAACAAAACGWLVWRLLRSPYRPLNAGEREGLWWGLSQIAVQTLLELSLFGCFGVVGLMLWFGGLGAALILLPFAGAAYYYRHRICRFFRVKNGKDG